MFLLVIAYSMHACNYAMRTVHMPVFAYIMRNAHRPHKHRLKTYLYVPVLISAFQTPALI